MVEQAQPLHCLWRRTLDSRRRLLTTFMTYMTQCTSNLSLVYNPLLMYEIAPQQRNFWLVILSALFQSYTISSPLSCLWILQGPWRTIFMLSITFSRMIKFSLKKTPSTISLLLTLKVPSRRRFAGDLDWNSHSSNPLLILYFIFHFSYNCLSFFVYNSRTAV